MPNNSIGPSSNGAEDHKAAVLEFLNNIFAYSIGDPSIELVEIRTASPGFIKAVTNRKVTYYFPLASRRRGTQFQVLSVLRRMSEDYPMKWDSDGNPVAGARLIDDLSVPGGEKWYQTIPSDLITPIVTTSISYLAAV
jgi:hypothetical protein